MPECEVHGGDIWSFSRNSGFAIRDVLDLSSNANDFFFPKIDFIEASSSIRYYPEVDLSDFKEKLSRLCLTSSDNVAITGGLTDFIYRHMNRYASKTVIVLTPSYGEFRKSSSVFGVNTVYLPSDIVYRNPNILNNYRFSSLIISRPEPPTGNFANFNTIESLLNIADAAGASTLIDEAFIDFVTQYNRSEARKLIDSYGSIYLGRSLTKVLPFPGLRIGYVLASRESIETFESEKKPWAVGQFDLSILREIDFSFIKDLPNIVMEEREYLIRNMTGLGYRVSGEPSANFVTFKAPAEITCDDLQRFLTRHGIMIRCLESFGSFDNTYFRIAVRRRELLNRFLKAVRLFRHER